MRRRHKQRGQAAFEFIFALLILMGMIAVLFQALHFELDVFNKTMLVRYKLLEEARKDEDETRPRMITEELEGKELGDLIPWEVPFQTAASDLKYGPKTVSWQCGTKYFFPGGDAALTGMKTGIGLLMVADHAQDLAGHGDELFEALGSATDAIASACP